MSTWIDYGIITIIVIVVLGIFYNALKEPIDLVLGWIGKMLGASRDKIADMTSGEEVGTTVIKYG